jgi:large subunit ribosomal protein L4
MQVEVLNWDNQVVETKELDEAIFAVATRKDVIQRVVQWQRAKAQAGTHSTKTRENVSGSTRKIYAQKGGGRARHGSIKAPIFVGGGITFGPLVRSHAFSLNKKVRDLGLKSALSTKLREGNIIFIDSLDIGECKTSAMVKKLNSIGINNKEKVLMVDSLISNDLKLSSGNLHKVDVLPVIGLNVLDIVNHHKLIISKSAIDNIQTRLKKMTGSA